MLSTLSDEDLKHFQTYGYVRVSGAFSLDVALDIQNFMWQQLEELGIQRDDSETWHNDVKQVLKQKQTHPFYAGVASPKLCGAVTDLFETDDWKRPAGWGRFLVTFPNAEPHEWDVADALWHWDANPMRNVDGLIDLFCFTIYSSVAPRGGGTMFLEGSHHLVEDFCRRNPGRNAGDKKIRRQILRSHPLLSELDGFKTPNAERVRHWTEEINDIHGFPLRVLEMTGEPGDAYFLHPAVLHATARNASKVPRFMRGRMLACKR